MKTLTVSAPLRGVTRQSLPLRQPPGMTDSRNADFGLVRGCHKRNPRIHVAKLSGTTPVPDYRTLGWERGDGSLYHAFVADGSVRVFDGTTGVEFFLKNSIGLGYLTGATRSQIRLLRAGDYVYVLNTNKAVAMGGATTSGPSTAGLGFVFVKQGNYDKSYTITFTSTLGTFTYTCLTYQNVATPFVPPPAGKGTVGSGFINSIKTEDIAEDLKLQINAGTGASGVTATRVGSVLRLTVGTAFTEIRTSDADGDRSMLAILGHAARISDLPLICEGGAKVLIDGDSTDTDADDFYVEFQAQAGGTAFGEGRWVESNGYNVVKGFDASTMPHRLTRKVDDALGTVTGVPNSVYFEWERPPWTERIVGDATTNPNPAFVGSTIRGMFYWQDRLGFLTGPTVDLSEGGDPNNFFRTTLQSLPDTERIEIGYSGPYVSLNYAAVPSEDVVAVFSSFATFALTFTDRLSPKTVAMSQVSAFDSEYSTGADPVFVGRQVFFPTSRSSTTILRELIRTDGSSVRFLPSESNIACPDFIPGMALELKGSGADDAVAVRTDNDATKLYVHRFFWNGDTKSALSWTIYAFSGSVVGFEFLKGNLHVLIKYADGLYLETIPMSTVFVDPGRTYPTCLDRRVSQASTTRTYDSATNRTKFTLPYRLATTSMSVVTDDGVPLAVLGTSAVGATPSYVEVLGDRTSGSYWIGETYTAYCEIDQPILRVPEESVGKYGLMDPEATVLGGAVQFGNSGPFSVVVTARDGRSWTQNYTAPNGSVVLDEAVLMSGSFRFPVRLRETEAKVRITSDSAVPFALGGISWTFRTSLMGRTKN